MTDTSRMFCAWCGKELTDAHPKRRTCTPSCRTMLSRYKRVVEPMLGNCEGALRGMSESLRGEANQGPVHGLSAVRVPEL